MINIIQVGTGGTGGHLVHFLAPCVFYNKEVKYLLVDGDIVEEKNIARQNFTYNDIGYYKSEVLGKRYNTQYLTEFLTEELLEKCLDATADNVILGCVDKVETRLMIDAFLKQNKQKYNAVYIDGGNTDKNAQVVIYDYVVNEGVDITEYFKEVRDEDLKTASCSELGDQTIQANMMSATYICTNVCHYIRNRHVGTKRKTFKNYKFIITPRIVSILKGVEE